MLLRCFKIMGVRLCETNVCVRDVRLLDGIKLLYVWLLLIASLRLYV